jgi:hypothetical protein
MLAFRLVRLIENHSDELARTLLERVQNSPQIPDYERVPADELRQRVYEIYRHLGDWLMGKTEFDIEQRYREIGRRRAAQGIPISQLMWTITLTKENLFEFMKRESALERPIEVFGEFELLQILEQFFDHAIFYAAAGYEETPKKESCAVSSVA